MMEIEENQDSMSASLMPLRHMIEFKIFFTASSARVHQEHGAR